MLWWPGFTLLIAACKRLCVVLHFYGARQLRPWELFGDDEENGGDKHPTPRSGKGNGGFRKHPHNDVSVSSDGSRGADPLRKSSLQPFGPKNGSSEEHWVAQYQRQSIFQRVMGETTPIQNTTLRLQQDRTVFFAVVWGGLLASALTAASLFVPTGSLL